MDSSLAAYELLLGVPGGLAEADVEVELDPMHDRQPGPPEHERLIEATWAARFSRNPALFNGSKFRFAGVAHAASGLVTLKLGITDYRDFLGTNCADQWSQLLTSGAHCLASPLGNAAIVETADNQVLLLRRSGAVGEVSHVTVLPGGHPEPAEIGLTCLEDWRAGRVHAAAWSKRARRELWDSVLREVIEETGVPRDALCEPLCLGLSRRIVNHRPVATFVVQCSLPAAHVVELYRSGMVQDRDESTGIFTLPREDFVRQALAEANPLGMVGCQIGGVMVYREHLRLRDASCGG